MKSNPAQSIKLIVAKFNSVISSIQSLIFLNCVLLVMKKQVMLFLGFVSEII